MACPSSSSIFMVLTISGSENSSFNLLLYLVCQNFHILHAKKNKKTLLEFFDKKVSGELFSDAWQEIASTGVLLQVDLEQIISHAEFQQHRSEGTLGEPVKCVQTETGLLNRKS
jgi:hypothetical protein